MVFHKSIIYFLSLVAILVWLAVYSVDTNLQIIACDVGQGDAILIQRNTTQILIDGGPNQSVLNCLGRHLPFWDKQIELVILTHSQEDHYAGLIDVFKTYKILNFGESNTTSSSQGYEVLEKLVGGSGVRPIPMQQGTTIGVGMIHLDTVWPKPNSEATNVNDDGVVMILKYAQFEALFTADIENEVSDIISEYQEIQNLNYIKVNHHGSRNGMSQKLLNAVNPEVAVISSGERNNYGHPHAEILKMLEEKSIKVLRTDEIGDVVVWTSGLDTLKWQYGE